MTNRLSRLAIADQPDNVVVCPGHQAHFSVAASGLGLRYQWYKDGLPLDIRAPKFIIVTATANDLGSYRVVVTDRCGHSVASQTARLSFKPAPELIDQPDDVIACLGQQATFSVMATGANPRYQWYKDGRPLNGVVAPRFTIVTVTAADLGAYHVVVTDECGASVTSRSVKLSLTPAPVFITQPADAEVCVGYQAVFTASANGDVARYEWYKDGVLLGGGTVLHVVTAPSSEGLYHAVAIDKCGRRVESRKARLSLGGPVTITQQPVSVAARAGQSVTFSVAATGGNLKFKWRKNGANILGAASESSSFTIPSVSAADAGSYSVVVYNACGPAKESAAATLTVPNAAPTNDSRFIIQNAPVTMAAGGRYNVSVTFRNTGASTWTAANGYKLVSQAPLNNTTWGLNEVPFPSSVASVAPGADVTFSFTVTAPATSGRYRFDWRMTQGTVGFGGFTPGLEISVTQ
jgi:membrane carboxypeptidase/penicillin-binding protein PbpC